MTARRSTTPAVTLFPFLAVLVCAMGALILLLLVTTRRIRQQTFARAAAAVDADTPDPETVPALPDPLSGPFDDEPILPLLASDPPPPLPAPVTPEPGPDLWAERMAELRAEWQDKVNELERQHRQVRAALAEVETGLSRDESRADLHQAALAAALRQLDDAEDGLESARQRKQSLLLRQSELEHEIRDSRNRLQQVIDEQAQAAGQFQVLPYDGITGTNRRPILIECADDGFHFLSDGVRLTPDDVNGFTPQQNPLLAGTEALLSYWSARDLNSRDSDAPSGRPYVLLIVRPGGTLAYYIARRLLEPLDEPFGYELVTDQQIAPPASTPQAKAALERSIEFLLEDRNRLLARTRGGTLPVADELRFSDGSGKFYLDEVERLREQSSTVHFGGREVERRQTRSSRADAAAPRVVEFPRGPQQGAGRTSSDLYDSQIAPDPADSAGNMPPPRRRTFEADGPIGWQSSRTPGDEAPQQPTGSDAERFQLPRRERPLDVEDPEWGIRRPGSSIGLERDVTIRIDASRVLVEDEEPLPITTGVSREELQRNLAHTLDQHVRGWGTPPNSFFWLPSIRFEVAPGGHQYHQRLQRLVDGWNLRSTVEYVLE